MAKRIITVLLALLGALLAVALVYVAYVMVTYERLPDNLALAVDAPLGADEAAPVVSADEEFTVVTANLGFGAYNRAFDFFMDGGTGSVAESPEVVREDILGSAEAIRALSPDSSSSKKWTQTAPAATTSTSTSFCAPSSPATGRCSARTTTRPSSPGPSTHLTAPTARGWPRSRACPWATRCARACPFRRVSASSSTWTAATPSCACPRATPSSCSSTCICPPTGPTLPSWRPSARSSTRT